MIGRSSVLRASESYIAVILFVKANLSGAMLPLYSNFLSCCQSSPLLFCGPCLSARETPASPTANHKPAKTLKSEANCEFGRQSSSVASRSAMKTSKRDAELLRRIAYDYLKENGLTSTLEVFVKEAKVEKLRQVRCCDIVICRVCTYRSLLETREAPTCPS